MQARKRAIRGPLASEARIAALAAPSSPQLQSWLRLDAAQLQTTFRSTRKHRYARRAMSSFLRDRREEQYKRSLESIRSLDSQALAAVANFRPHRSAFESSTKAHFHRLAPLKASLAIAAARTFVSIGFRKHSSPPRPQSLSS